MKTFFAIVLLLLSAVWANGEKMRCTLLGKWSQNHSSPFPVTALFDGQLAFNAPHVIWDSSVATKGCGVLLDFGVSTKLSTITIVTAKPNQLAWSPARTLFQAWDETKHEWRAETVVPDVTGRVKDSSFVSAKPVETTWEANCETTAVRILMFGAGIWLTEVRVQDSNGEELKAESSIAIPESATRLAPCGRGGGASVNINFYNEKQPYIGNPNALNRQDRVLVNFDLRPFLLGGKIEKATLSLYLAPIGNLESNRLEVERLTAPRTSLQAMDLIATDTSSIASFLFDQRTQPPWLLDVTSAVNEALERGEGYLAFRLRNLTIEKVGNRKNQPEGTYLNYDHTFLDIIP